MKNKCGNGGVINILQSGFLISFTRFEGEKGMRLLTGLKIKVSFKWFGKNKKKQN